MITGVRVLLGFGVFLVILIVSENTQAPIFSGWRTLSPALWFWRQRWCWRSNFGAASSHRPVNDRKSDRKVPSEGCFSRAATDPFN